MVNHPHVAFKVEDRSYFALIKKQIHAFAVAENFSEKKINEIDIIVAEMVSNLVKHAGGGRVLVKRIETEEQDGIELISIDHGPGMSDVTRMVADGVSTKNTLGHGLGAMQRLSDVFQIYSQKDWGTILLVRVFNEEMPLFKKPDRIDIRSVMLPKPGEEKCGDGFFHSVSSSHIRLFLGDGLGHGLQAEKAVQAAGQAFLESDNTDPVELIRLIDSAVRKTRGLVGTAAVFDLKAKKWQICGVGNIATKVNSMVNTRSYMAYNGIIGLNVPNTLNAQEVSYEKGQYIVMASDGLKSRWDTIKYPALLRYDLSILCATLVKDFARNTDDLSAVACKINL